MSPEIAAADAQLLIRLVVAAALSAALGWERERARKSAGLRTHMLVGVGSTLFVVLGDAMAAHYGGDEAFRSDPARLIQAVAAGIGFLGAGTIFMAPEHRRVQGLTTAASIWATAAVGAAAALERYVLAAGSTAILLVVLHVLTRFTPQHGRDAT